MEIQNAGRYKKIILALLFAGWFIGNIDRYVINYAIVDIAKYLNLTASSTGLVLSSFFLGMTLMQIPGGWLTDRFGYRKVLLTIVFVWSLFTGLTGAAWSLGSMLFIRFMFGVGEGSFYPAGTKTISSIFPKSERSRAISIVLGSGAIAGLLTPIFTTTMMLTIGWRNIFYLIGSFGIIIVLLFWIFLKPEEGNKQDNDSTKKVKVPFIKVFKTPLVWSLFIAYFGVYTVAWGQGAWLPTYLVKIRHLDLMSLGMWQMIPGFVSFLGFYVSGQIIDRLKPGQDKVVAIICSLASAVLLFLMYSTPTVVAFIIYQSLQQIFLAFMIVMMPSVAMKNLPIEIVGSASGFINFGGQLAGFLTPMIMGFVIDLFMGSFAAAFGYMIIFACVSSIAFMTLGHHKGVVFDLEKEQVA